MNGEEFSMNNSLTQFNSNELYLQEESELIKKSIKNIKNQCEKNQFHASREIIVQNWLFNEICKNLIENNINNACRIREEYSLFDHHLENKNQIKPKDYWKKNYPKYLEHEKNEIDFDGKSGRIDIVILNKEKEKILHAIEIKEITSYYPSSRHLGYEDIYVLSDLLRIHNITAQSYIFIIGWYKSKGRISKEKMNDYLKKVRRDYENANVYCDFIIFDKSIEKIRV